jgi:hypothetical protein
VLSRSVENGSRRREPASPPIGAGQAADGVAFGVSDVSKDPATPKTWRRWLLGSAASRLLPGSKGSD